MNSRTPAQIAALDRRYAAIHEAGHIVVAAQFGRYPVSAWIVPNPDVEVEPEKTWIGRVQFAPGAFALTPLQRRMVGCAGAVAELSWLRAYVDPDYWREANFMSPSDWDVVDCPPGVPDDLCVEAIERLQYLLSESGPLWNGLLQHARRLICDAR